MHSSSLFTTIDRLKRLAAVLLLTTIIPLAPSYLSAQDEEEDEADVQEEPETPAAPTNGHAANNPPAAPAAAGAANTEINVKNADIGAIIKIFSRKTKRNYILDEKVKGKVSIYLPAKVSDSESVRILDAILALKGFTSVPIGENLWKIVPIKEARQSTIPTLTEDRDSAPTAAVVTRLVRLKYVDAGDMQQLLGQLISPEGMLNAYPRTNSLILIDSEDNIRRLLDIIEAVDIAASDREMTIIPIKNADAKDIADTLNEILGDGGGKDSQQRSGSERALDLIRARIREASGSPEGTAAIQTGGTPGSSAQPKVASEGPKIIPDDRTNSIIVVADDTATARIRALIDQLDSKVDLSGQRFYVYRCQHASAEELADVLGGITGSGSSSSGSSRASLSGNSDSDGLSNTGLGSTGSRRSTSGSNSRTQDRLANQRRTPGQSRLNSGSRSGVAAVNFGEEMSITADPATNSLIIAASKSDYEKIKELLVQLDIKRRQVLIEAVLLEVTLSEAEALGTEFLASGGGADGGVAAINNLGNLTNLFTNPTALTNFSIAAATSGSLTLPGGIVIPTQSALVTAAQNSSNVNVLSSPTILTTDNEQAEIVVGENVPFLASTSSSADNLNNTFNQIDRQDVGITLRLTPQISSGDFVTLNLFTEVSAVVGSTLDSTLGPTTTVRTSETTVITKDSQMVVIGGLMSDDINTRDRGIPFLKDIPVLGGLFSFSSEDHTRRNLLIFITPRVIKDQYDHRELTVEKADAVSAVIKNSSVGPTRDNVLKSPRIDDVVESTPYDGPAPSTIRAPNSEQQPSSAASQVKELRVSPALPDAPRAALHSNANTSTTALYIVLELDRSAKDRAKDAPFTLTPSAATGSSLVAIELPAGSGPQAAQFFRAGNQYGYNLAAGSLKFRVMGLFPNRTDATSVYPEISSSWYTLSPYEIMGLGKGPWTKQ